jgi:hypothetical protein
MSHRDSGPSALIRVFVAVTTIAPSRSGFHSGSKSSVVSAKPCGKLLYGNTESSPSANRAQTMAHQATD